MSRVIETPLAQFERLAAEAGLAYAIIGGHAVNIWLAPRFTADIDITIAAAPEAYSRLEAQLQAAGWRIDRVHGADQPSGPDFVRLRRGDGEPPLELQTAKTDFQDQVIARAQTTDQGHAATAEDLVVLKLIAFRAKDRLDLIGLLELEHLDWSYIDHWVDVWAVRDRLERARRA